MTSSPARTGSELELFHQPTATVYMRAWWVPGQRFQSLPKGAKILNGRVQTLRKQISAESNRYGRLGEADQTKRTVSGKKQSAELAEHEPCRVPMLVNTSIGAVFEPSVMEELV